MEVARIAIGLGFLGIAAYGFFAFTGPEPSSITVTEARLHPMGDALILAARIDNPGAPDRLTGIGSEAAARALLTREDLVVPGDSAPVLAMDGAHGVLMGLQGETAEGRLIPVTLWFEEAGRITTRARIVADGMDHSRGFDVPEGEPMPQLTVAVSEVASDGAWSVTLETSDFTFSEDAVDGPHQPGVGHAHLYLNGLKLARLYSASGGIGALPSGQHTVEVVLNTNDHQAYVVDGQRVSATATIVVE